MTTEKPKTPITAVEHILHYVSIKADPPSTNDIKMHVVNRLPISRDLISKYIYNLTKQGKLVITSDPDRPGVKLFTTPERANAIDQPSPIKSIDDLVDVGWRVEEPTTLNEKPEEADLTVINVEDPGVVVCSKTEPPTNQPDEIQQLLDTLEHLLRTKPQPMHNADQTISTLRITAATLRNDLAEHLTRAADYLAKLHEN